MAIKDDYYVVDFQFIDDYRCLRPLSEAFDPFMDHIEEISEEEKVSRGKKLYLELTALFLKAGWEGDGEIGCIFVPPCFLGRDDGSSETVYHVKQKNNGVSWLAIPKGMQLTMPKGSGMASSDFLRL